LQVTSFDGKRQSLAFFYATFLIRRCRAESGIESNVIFFVPGWSGFDVTSVLALCFG